jgi:thymidine kinase
VFAWSRRTIGLADRVQVETVCWCGHRATSNARVVDGAMVLEREQVMMGDMASDNLARVDYEVLCRHHLHPMTSHASPEVPAFELDLCPIPASTLNV